MSADYSIWPDDTGAAAGTLALAAATDSDPQMGDVITSIEAGVSSGRPVEYVLELLRMLTAGLGDQFSNDAVAAEYRQLAAQAQAHEDDMRARGEWRDE